MDTKECAYDVPETVETFYQLNYKADSDIADHLPVLRDMARRAGRVLEIGTRTGRSTAAFIASGAKFVTCIDRSFDQLNRAQYRLMAQEAGCELFLVPGDSCILGPGDLEDPINRGGGFGLLFIDGFHTYANVAIELMKWHNWTTDQIAIHDTELYGENGEAGQAGIMPAINDFVATHKQWDIVAHYPECNGLTVLERVM